MTPYKMAGIIAKKEGCVCRYVETVSVVEKFKGNTVWDGIVFVFNLIRPPDETCYGWVDPDAKELVTVLKRPPVESPETAVRAYIVSKTKK
jgi:hypothetical protein